MRVAALLFFPTLAFAAHWSGTLVDSTCYLLEERNVNPTDTLTSVDRDQNQEIRLCAPGRRTKSFTLVQHDGLSFKLDSTGNAKAAELVRNSARKSAFAVVLTGELSGPEIKVDSISLVK